MKTTSQRELNEHLDATFMVAPTDILKALNDTSTGQRNRAVEWIADHLAWRLRHYDIQLVKSSDVTGDAEAVEFNRAEDTGLELQDYVD